MIPDRGHAPWLDRLRDEVPGIEPLDAHTHIGSNDPDGYAAAARSCRAARARSTPAASFSRCTSRTATPPPTTWSSRGRGERRPAVAVLPARPALTTRSPRPSARSGAERAGSSCIRGRSSSRSTTPGSTGVRARERAPAAGDGARRAAASRRSGAPLGRGHRAAPGMRLILAARRHLGPRLDLARGADPPQPLLRHRLVVAQRPPGPVRARGARPDPDGERRALRVTHVGHRDVARTRSRWGLTPTRLRGVLGGQALRLVDGDEPLDLGPAPGAEQLSARPAARPRTRSSMAALGQMFQGVEPGRDAGARRARLRRGRRCPAGRGLPLDPGLLDDQRQRYSPRRATAGRPLRARAPLRAWPRSAPACVPPRMFAADMPMPVSRRSVRVARLKGSSGAFTDPGGRRVETVTNSLRARRSRPLGR